METEISNQIDAYFVHSVLSCFASFQKTTIIVMASLPTLPVHLVYCILDNLQPVDILMSVCNVCTRLNSIIDSYRPYQVKKKSLL